VKYSYRLYVQVAYLLATPRVVEREFGVLRDILGDRVAITNLAIDLVAKDEQDKEAIRSTISNAYGKQPITCASARATPCC
jgi:hypothetical protein